jgi:rhodanese-related sulfurtransferase/ubiquinone/menaquinone biosynthesis C-methylase UbiE
MRSTVEKSHWERIYDERDPHVVSWYQPAPERSLKLIEAASPSRTAAILDVGGGASTLAGSLLAAGYEDVTVADISTRALGEARRKAGDRASAIQWVEADIRDHDFGREYDVWHDRALFHFMVDPADRDLYVETLRRSLRAGGHVVIAGFGPEGPTRCSGLPVARYSGQELAAALGDDFQLLSEEPEVHVTPSGARQEFIYAHLRRVGGERQRHANAGVDELLAAARRRLRRLDPVDAQRHQKDGAILIDIRSESQRELDGEIPGAQVVPRNVLEWRLDPSCPARDPALARRDVPVILICNQGCQSSLAAATLKGFGLDATDVIGRAEAWIAAELPVNPA